MEQNDFIYWLVGFTEDKNTLSLVEMDIVKEKLEEVILLSFFVIGFGSNTNSTNAAIIATSISIIITFIKKGK